jgi:hypothetical protein
MLGRPEAVGVFWFVSPVSLVAGPPEVHTLTTRETPLMPKCFHTHLRLTQDTIPAAAAVYITMVVFVYRLVQGGNGSNLSYFITFSAV